MTALLNLLRRLAHTGRHRWNYSARRPGRLSCTSCTASRKVP